MHDILSKHLEILNRHLAENKKSLEALLREENPKIVLRDGSTHSFKKEELQRLAEIVPASLHGKLTLPIYVELSSGKYGKGTARIAGKTECMVIAGILGRENPGEELFIYTPELRKVRKKLPTTTQYMFTLSPDVVS